MLSVALTLSLLLPTASANDSVARISDAAHRGKVIQTQIDTIVDRINAADKSCQTILAPLPVPLPDPAPGTPDAPVASATVVEATPLPTPTMPFAQATTAIEKTLNVITSRFPQECAQMLLQEIALVQPRTPAIARIELALNDLAPRPYGIQNQALACEPPPTGIEELLGLAVDTDVLNACAPLAADKWKPVTGISPYGNPVNYSLLQTGDKVRIVLNVDFKDANPDAPGPVTPTMMMGRTRACMQAVSGLMKAPDGKNFEFDLLTPAEAERLPSDVRPKSYPITIEHSTAGEYIRSHAANYSTAVGCPTIVHEVLHLLGLCDEYPGEPDGYICRASPAQNTVMSDTFEAFSTSVPRTVTCECPDENCRSMMGLPGRIQFAMAKTFYDVTTPRFRNAYCRPNGTYASWQHWDKTAAQPPSPPLSLVLSADGSSIAINARSLIKPGENIAPDFNTCTCPEGDESCRRFIADLAAGRTTVQIRQCPNPMKEKDFAWGGTPSPERYENGILTLQTTPSNVPFIHPVHARRIVGGTCPTSTTSYNDCAARAYKSTSADCEGVPAHCLTPTPHDN